MTKKIGGVCFSAMLVLLAALPGPAFSSGGESPIRLGTIVYEDHPGSGADDASVRPVEDGDLVKCLSRSAVVRLAGGQVLKFDANTSAVLDGDPSGRVDVRVLSGRVSMIGAGDRWLTAGAGSFFTVRPTDVDPATAETLLWNEDRTVSDRGGRRSGRR